MYQSAQSFSISLIRYRLWLYLLFIGVTFSNLSYFPLWIYIATLLFSISLTAISFKLDSPHLRTFFDYLLIGVGVYHSTLYPECFILILFPLIASAIYRGNHHGYFDLCIYTIISLIINYYPERFSGKLLLPAFIFYAISRIHENRKRWETLEIELSTMIDRYFVQTSPDKPHNILKGIVNGLNSFFKKNFLLKDSIVEGIYVYSLLPEEGWFLRSGSQFWWKREIDSVTAIKGIDKMKDVIIRVKFGQQIRLFYPIHLEEEIYLFEFDIKSTLPTFIIFSLGLKRILFTTGYKFSHILAIDFRINNYRNQKFSEIRENIDYVNKAVNIMHFLRNRLSSIMNLIVYDNLPNDKKTLPSQLYHKQAKQAIKDINDIKNTAESLLDESHNPFRATDLESTVTLEKAYSILSEYSMTHLGINVNVSDEFYPTDKYYLKGSLLPYKLIFVDWLRNMQKYHNIKKSVNFEIKDNIALLKFINDAKNINDITTALGAINNKKKDMVIRKNTHGVALIKHYADGLGILLSASTFCDADSGFDLLCFTIEIPLYERDKDISV